MTRTLHSRIKRNPHVRTRTVAVGGAGGCLVASVFACFWLIGILIALALKIAIIAAIVAGVYWCFTGEWIGDAPFLN